MSKPRIKYSSKGWFRHWLTMLSGTKDIRTGAVFPDQHGCLQRELWVGPYASASDAMKAAL